MPIVHGSLSNANYKYLLHIAEARGGVSLTKALNGLIDDARARHYAPKIKVAYEVEEGKQALLAFDTGK